MRTSLILLAIAFASISGAGAKPLTYQLPEETATLRPAPDMETAQNNCAACHSFDYIETQPPKRGREFWEGEVNKMIHSYHAPISETDAKAIADYLSRAY
ncbi:cytochrome c [Methylocystis heyeri]|uniref:Cytochrome c n=1 Tax=Methylocystis heyeri TaxID=391905 RepID=A0A6B8KAG3_9HYPH|nr:cytochrome c [Methylocystis heyeri]QGM44839.1 cytochrome c [Methylocystis heyeri]